MKKKGYTLVELMVSIGIFSLILGVLGTIVITFTKGYDDGLEDVVEGNNVQTYFSYILSDMVPSENTRIEELKNIEIEITKTGSSEATDSITIKRSWETADKYVTYSLTNGNIFREVHSDENSNGTSTRIMSNIDGINLESINLNILLNNLKSRSGLLDSVEYIDVEKGGDGVSAFNIYNDFYSISNGEDGEDDDYNYYLEAYIKINGKEYRRGEAVRFVPEPTVVEEEEEAYFKKAIQMISGTGEVQFYNGYVKENPTNKISARIEESEGVTCRIIGGYEDDNENCANDYEYIGRLDIPYVNLEDRDIDDYSNGVLEPGSYKNVEEKGKTFTLTEGVYEFDGLELINTKFNIEDNANVKIYLTYHGVILSEGSSINNSGAPEQLLIVTKGDVIIKKKSLIKGFIYSENDEIQISAGSEIHGAVVNGTAVKLSEDYLEGDKSFDGENTLISYNGEDIWINIEDIFDYQGAGNKLGSTADGEIYLDDIINVKNKNKDELLVCKNGKDKWFNESAIKSDKKNIDNVGPCGISQGYGDTFIKYYPCSSTGITADHIEDAENMEW